MQVQLSKESVEKEQSIAQEQELLASQANQQLWMELHRGEAS